MSRIQARPLVARHPRPGGGPRDRRAIGECGPNAQVGEIAEIKMPDLNTNDLEQAKLQVAGTARSMGLRVI